MSVLNSITSIPASLAQKDLPTGNLTWIFQFLYKNLTYTSARNIPIACSHKNPKPQTK